MNSQLDLLYNELDLIYSKCSKGKFQTVPAQDLVEACVEEYARGNAELEDIIKESIDPEGSNRRISRSSFKKMLTDLMTSYQHEDCDSQTESQKLSSTICTPLTSLDYVSDPAGCKRNGLSIGNTGEGDFFMTGELQSSIFEVVKSLKEKNDALLAELCKAEENVSKLEENHEKLKLETGQINKNYLNEIETLKNVLCALQEKFVNLSEKYDKLLTENNKLTSCLRNKRNNDGKIEDLEFALKQTKEELTKAREETSHLKQVNTRLEKELSVSEDKVAVMVREVERLKSNLGELEASQQECIESLGRLQGEKRALETELVELRALSCHSDWLTEVSGMSGRNSEIGTEKIGLDETQHEVGVQANASRTVTICSLELSAVQNSSEFCTTYSNDSFRSLRASKRHFQSRDYWKCPSCPNFECYNTSIEEEIIQADIFNEKKYKVFKWSNIYLLFSVSAFIILMTNLYLIFLDESLNSSNFNTILPFPYDFKRTGAPPPL